MGNDSSQPLKYGQRLDNDITVNWKKLVCENPFAARDSHCSCSLNNKLYVFGGVVSEEGEPIESNDLIVYELDANKWSKAESKGDVPAPRSGATISAIGKKLYLFGGLSRETGWFDELYAYDTENGTWTLVKAQGVGPSPRDKVCSVVIGEKVYIFGGFGPQSIEEESLEEEEEDNEVPDDQEAAQFGWFNDLYIFDTTTNSWSSPMQMNICPVTPRAAHGMCALDKYITIFGGRDSEGRTNDLHIFDTETRKWLTDLKQEGRQPEPRSFHSCVAVGSRIVVTGGRGTSDQHFQDLHVFDTATRQWLQPTVQGKVPEGRGVHTLTVVGDQLVMYGGSSDFRNMQCHKFYNDLHTISSEDLMKPAKDEGAGNQEASVTESSVVSPTSSEGVHQKVSTQSNNDDDSTPAKRQKTDE